MHWCHHGDTSYRQDGASYRIFDLAQAFFSVRYKYFIRGGTIMYTIDKLDGVVPHLPSGPCGNTTGMYVIFFRWRSDRALAGDASLQT